MTLALTRTLTLANPLLHGSDVTSVQHLLTAKGFPVEVDGVFGPETGGACVAAKKRLRYVVANQTPTCGQALVDNLEAHAPFPPPPVPAARVRFVAQLRAAIAHKANWDYRQIRPIPHPGHVGRIVTDCSGGVTYLAECADCPDPNGRRFDGQGYTGTLLSHCAQITAAMLRPGDLVCYGKYPGHHVTATLDDHGNQFSHGRRGDPREVSLQDEISWQTHAGHATVTYLRFLP